MSKTGVTVTLHLQRESRHGRSPDLPKVTERRVLKPGFAPRAHTDHSSLLLLNVMETNEWQRILKSRQRAESCPDPRRKLKTPRLGWNKRSDSHSDTDE